jgi:signal transduction histidine kinase
MLGIRRWMIVGMLTFLAFPVLTYTVTDVISRNLVRQQTPQEQTALDTALGKIVAEPARWHDPAWQASIRETLDPLGAGVVLRDPSGAEIYRTGHVTSGGHPPWQGLVNRETTVVERGQQVGTVEFSMPQRDSSLARAAATVALVLALLHVTWRIRRSVVNPLEAMGRAARRIAAGNLDFTLPKTRVREVADVRDAFEAMGEGLRESLRQQAALEEERRFFVGAIAHDLRTPLFALRGSLVGMERGLATSPEKAARYIAVCRQKADQLDRLVDDLFAFTKAEYLEQTLRRERLAFGPVMERAVDSMGPQAREKDVEIALVRPDADHAIEGDGHLLERAVENLLDNALRYTPPGGTITVAWRVAAGRVTFTVADTGPGIAAQDLPHLFEPLFRAETSRNRETGGAGLGLTIARRILRAHGGDLVAANAGTVGAEFTGWLPLPTETSAAGQPAGTAAAARP